MNKSREVVCCVLVSFTLASCGLPTGLTNTPTSELLQTLPPLVETSLPPTNTPEPTLTPTVAPTETLQVYAQKQVEVSVEALNMRSGPGSVFEIVKRITKGSLLWILGRSQGDDWLLARDEANQAGWVSSNFIYYQGSLQDIPLFLPANALTITGRIVDQNQQPIPGVNLAVMKGNGSENVRTDIYSDSEGNFYAYLPEDTTGPWTLEIVGVLCTSSIMDANCKYSGDFSTDAFTIMVPGDIAIPLIFVYTP